jgi:LPS O-antigen subunit length determinant protein (WzzB/FepE family)
MMELKMKNTIIIISIIAATMLCTTSAIAKNTPAREISTAWPEAVTFSKLEMTRLDVMDPSYQNRIKNIRTMTNSGPFTRWENLIDNQL